MPKVKSLQPASYGLIKHKANSREKMAIKRVGKDIVITSNEGTQLLSRDKLDSVVAKVICHNGPTKIQTTGLSKAQVEKIAGSFIQNSVVEVEVRHVPRPGNGSKQLQRFEIVVKGGTDDV